MSVSYLRVAVNREAAAELGARGQGCVWFHLKARLVGNCF